MNNGGGNGGGSFKVKHGSYAAEVTNVHEAGAGEVGDVVGEREMRIESNTKLSATNNNSCACGFRNKTFLRQCNQTLIDPTIVVCNLCPDSNIHMREWSVRHPSDYKM